MQFTLDYAEQAVIADGTPVLLRLLRRSDKAMLRRGFEQLSAQSRYARFLAPKLTLTDSELRYLTEIDHDNHFALGAIHDGEGFGIARFIRMDDPSCAEVAIAVADHAQRKGLGRLLFTRLVAAAAERNITTLRLELLGTNYHMRKLLLAVAPDHTSEITAGVLSIAFSPTRELAARASG